MRQRRFALFLLPLLAACSSSPGARPHVPAPADAAAPETPADNVTPSDTAAGWTHAPRARGVPHNARINRIALSPGGAAAATLDSTGHVRVWPSLDGSSEPIPVPVRAASQLALARVGDELLIAVLDTARTLQLVSLDKERAITPVYKGSPGNAVTDVVVLESTGIVAALHADRSIVFRSRTGAELARFDERAFRPKSLMVGGSNTLLALELDSSTVRLHRFTIEVVPSGARVKKVGAPREIDAEGFVDAPGMMSLSPDAKHLAIVRQDRKKGRWALEIVDLDGEGAESVKTTALGTNRVNQPFSVGFVAKNRAVLRFAQGGGTWMVDIEKGSSRALPARFSGNDVSRAIGPDRVVAAIGSSLYTFQPSTGKSLYLSYRHFFPLASAVSPSGKRFAYISGRDLYVDDYRTARMRWRELEEQFTLRFVAFADDDHLILVSSWGEMRIVEWDSARIVARSSGPGVVTHVHYDPIRKLLLLMPQQGQVWLVKIGGTSTPAFEGPYIVADGANRTGFLSGPAAVWTLDPSNIIRHYTWDEVVAGVSRLSGELRGARVTHVHPLSIDRAGRILANLSLNGRQTVGAFKGPESALVGATSVNDDSSPHNADRQFKVEYQKPDAKLVLVSPSAVHSDPSGRQLIVAAQGLASANDASSLESKWSIAFPNTVSSVSWNRDGNVVGMTTREGVMFVKARDGEILHRTCGPVFVVSEQPPTGLHGRGGFTHSICESR